MTDNNDNTLYTIGRFKVSVGAEGDTYEVLNTQTGVVEVTDSVLGKCITFAESSDEFLKSFERDQQAEQAKHSTLVKSPILQ